LYAVCVQQFKIFSASLLTYAPWYFDFPRLSLTVGTTSCSLAQCRIALKTSSNFQTVWKTKKNCRIKNDQT